MEESRKQSLMKLLKERNCVELRNPDRLLFLKYERVLSFKDFNTIGFFYRGGHIGNLVIDKIDTWEVNENNVLYIYIKKD